MENLKKIKTFSIQHNSGFSSIYVGEKLKNLEQYLPSTQVVIITDENIKHFYQKDKRLRALMIEVRRDLYMDEQSAEKLPGFDEVRNILRRQLAELVKFRE